MPDSKEHRQDVVWRYMDMVKEDAKMTAVHYEATYPDGTVTVDYKDGVFRGWVDDVQIVEEQMLP